MLHPKDGTSGTADELKLEVYKKNVFGLHSVSWKLGLLGESSHT